MTGKATPSLSKQTASGQSYDGVVSQRLIDALGGPLASVLARHEADVHLRDLQLRRGPKRLRSWCSLYVGLTSVLTLEESGADRFRLTVHATHRQGGFDPAWAVWQALDDLAAVWTDVEGYLSPRGLALLPRRRPACRP